MIGLSFASAISAVLTWQAAGASVVNSATGSCAPEGSSQSSERSLLQVSTFHRSDQEPIIGDNTSLASVNEGLNGTALALFENLRQSFERTYPLYGRATNKYDDSPTAVTLDFEFETRAQVQLTPELLLERGAVDKGLFSANQIDVTGLAWPKVSKWFTVGLDGNGQHNPAGQWRQTLKAVVELESVLMTPKAAVRSPFTKDLATFLDQLQSQKVQKGDVFSLPFKGSEGIKINGRSLRKSDKPCLFCGLQWTAGLPLRHVPELLRLSADRHWKRTLSVVDALCSQRPNGCLPEYHAFVSLAATVLRKVRRCGCDHPKRCMKSWLVRTHFGDLAMHIKEKLGQQEFENIPNDVLVAGEFDGTEQVMPNGTIDYLRLPEFAEVGGMVFPRKPSSDELVTQAVQDMPTDIHGLMDLSKRLLQNRAAVSKRLRNRECHVHNRTTLPSSVSSFTVKDWLDGLMQGKDLMSDHDSELSKASFSHLMWKSMGHWRMKPGSDRVYLECRRTKLCLAGSMPQKGPSGLIQMVARKMRRFEQEIEENEEKSANESLAAGPIADE